MDYYYLDFAIIPYYLAYDGEGDGDGGDGDGDGDGDVAKETPPPTPAQKNPTPPPTPGKTLTQEEVNKILATERRKSQQNRDQLVTELKTLRDSVQLTEQQREQLESRIEQLQNETLTSQELAKKDRERLQKEFEKDKGKLTTERDFWQTLYTTEKIQRDLTDAAITNKALNPVQVVNLLRPNAKLVEELRDGKPTGGRLTKVTFFDKDEKGEPISLELSVTEAVKRMSDMPEHGNLFNSGANGGLGSFNAGSGSTLRGKRPPSDPTSYEEWRKQNIRK
jgi:hypothetical protein